MALALRLIIRLIFQGRISQRMEIRRRTWAARMKLRHEDGDHVFLWINGKSGIEESSPLVLAWSRGHRHLRKAFWDRQPGNQQNKRTVLP